MDSTLYSTCLTLPAIIRVMNGDEIRAARERKGWKQSDLAKALKVGARTVGNWENGRTVPQNRTAMIRQVLDMDISANPLADLSDLELLGELTRRAFERAQRRTG